jgi:hypothetical protein
MEFSSGLAVALKTLICLRASLSVKPVKDQVEASSRPV